MASSIGESPRDFTRCTICGSLMGGAREHTRNSICAGCISGMDIETLDISASSASPTIRSFRIAGSVDLSKRGFICRGVKFDARLVSSQDPGRWFGTDKWDSVRIFRKIGGGKKEEMVGSIFLLSSESAFWDVAREVRKESSEKPGLSSSFWGGRPKFYISAFWSQPSMAPKFFFASSPDGIRESEIVEAFGADIPIGPPSSDYYHGEARVSSARKMLGIVKAYAGVGAGASMVGAAGILKKAAEHADAMDRIIGVKALSKTYLAAAKDMILRGRPDQAVNYIDNALYEIGKL